MSTVEENRRRWRREHRCGVPSAIWLDEKLRAYIDTHAERMSYVALAKACRQRFGRGRSPSKSSIARYRAKRMAEHGVARKRCSTAKIYADAKIRAFIDRHLPEMTFERLAKACRRKFGAHRAPSLSAIHRYYLSRRAPRRATP